jgi:dTDP-4-amino-4,6-dideoxygalactose transaminase
VKPERAFFHVPLAMPYWQRSTYRSMGHSLGTGRIVMGAEGEKLRKLLLHEMSADQALLCSSGSLALELALRGCEVDPGDEVVLPTFCCAAVVLPVLAVGATAVLADVGPELNLTVETVGAALTQKTKAIIVPHLFGNPAEIGAIMELVRARNIRVIDDAAQALGATIDGRPVGSFGDAGIVSFGAEKVCFGLGGGALLAGNENFSDGVLVSALAPPRALPTIENLFSVLIRRRWRRWTWPLDAGRRTKNALGPDASPRAYHREGMANLNAAVALTLMQSLTDNIAARRARVRRYTELFHGVDRLELIPHRPGSACLTQVLRVRAKREDRAVRVIHALRRAGYEVQGSYVPIHRLANYSMCVWDNVTHAERIWSDLVELPCEPDVKMEHLERIAAVVKAEIRD